MCTEIIAICNENAAKCNENAAICKTSWARDQNKRLMLTLAIAGMRVFVGFSQHESIQHGIFLQSIKLGRFTGGQFAAGTSGGKHLILRSSASRETDDTGQSRPHGTPTQVRATPSHVLFQGIFFVHNPLSIGHSRS